MDFDTAFLFIMKWEGGGRTTHDPDDPGGTTKYGISQRAHPTLNIEGLTEAEAKNIYKREYWDISKASELPKALRLAHFDAAVNMGVRRANLILQKTLEVRQDAILGAITMRTAHNHGSAALPGLLANRSLFHMKLVEMNQTNRKYLFGWLRRVSDVGIQTDRRWRYGFKEV